MSDPSQRETAAVLRARRARPATRRRLATVCSLVMAAGLVGLLGGCASASPLEHAATVTLTLYNGQHQQTTDAIVKSFEAAHPGIKVQVRNDDEDTLADEIVQEGSRSPADVFYTENTPALAYLDQKGRLSRLEASTLRATPSKYDAADGDWVGVSARVSVLIYNPSLIKKSELPTTVLQLASPRYKGKLALAAGETDFQPIVTAVERAYGTKRTLAWLGGIKSNAGGSHLYPDNETVTSQVNRGQVAFGIINQYYWYRLRAEIGASNIHSAIAYFAPHDPGYVIDVSGAAVLRSSKHQSAAQELVAYLVSKPAQEIIATPSKSISFEYPIAAGVTTKAPEAPFSRLQPYPITTSELGTGATAIALLREEQLL